MTGWHTFDVQITANSPLHLGDESNFGNFLHTRSAIPGANLRAVIADRALAACTQPQHKTDHTQCPDRRDCPFWQVFGEGAEPHFGYAYPGQRGPAHPFPLTARTCKLHPGYPTRGEEAHGVHDAMVDQFVYNLLADPEFPRRDQLQPGLARQWAHLQTPLPNGCPVCGGALMPMQGTYVQNPDTFPDDAGRMSVRRATHVGINRARAVAEDSLLYTQETIEPAFETIAFHARIAVPQQRADLLRDYLKGSYYIGRGRSRGLGSVNLTIRHEQQENTGDELRKRLESFRLAVRSTLARYQLQDERITLDWPGTLVSLTLRSPAILEAFGTPSAQPAPALLGLSQAHLLHAWARSEIITGWDAAAHMPRRTRLGIQAGSVFLYWVSPDLPEETLWQQLQKIETDAIGEERPRGYGQVTVWAPFHLHNRLGK